jgi:hypothetical protein
MPKKTNHKGSEKAKAVWDYNKKTRSLDGLIDLAKAGNASAFRTLLGHLVLRYENSSRRNRDLKLDDAYNAWLADCFVKVLGGETLDRAFGQAKVTRGRPSKQPQDLRKEIEMAAQVARLIDDDKTREAAIAEVAEANATSESSIRDAWDTFRISESGK